MSHCSFSGGNFLNSHERAQAHLGGINFCMHLKVKRGLQEVVCADAVRKRSECENVSLKSGVSCLSQPLRNKAFEHI